MTDQPLASYTESRLGGRRTYALLEDRIVIRGTHGAGSRIDCTVRLDTLDPCADRIWTRGKLFREGILLMNGAVVVGAVFMLGFVMKPEGVGVLAGLAAVGAVMTALGARRVEFARFKNRWGSAVFEIARAGPAFDTFVEAIVEQVRKRTAAADGS